MTFEEINAAPFGTLFAEQMGVSDFVDGAWSDLRLDPTGPIPIHPAAHVLHYASTIFEGLKAYRHANGDIGIFRLERHATRMAHSAKMLALPFPGEAAIVDMVRTTVAANRDDIPGAPGSLYIRPTLFGTDANVGAAATAPNEAMLVILNCPVGSYFKGGETALKILVDQRQRSTPGFGQAKTGGNYAASLRLVLAAKKEHGAKQVLFCPDKDVQETGAANFLIINDKQVMTKPLSDDFLHGITRDSVLRIAESLGYLVVERDFTVDELREMAPTSEAALSGTAAVLAGVGSLIIDGEEVTVGSGEVGPNTKKLRKALTNIQQGQTADPFGWLTTV